MTIRLHRVTQVSFLGMAFMLTQLSESRAEILYDNLANDIHPLSYRLEGGDLNWVEDGLNFTSSGPNGIVISTDEGELPESESWSFRSEFTINAITGFGLAGVGVADPGRWAGVFSSSREYAVGQGFSPDTLRIVDGNPLDERFVVQIDATGDTLTGHFWRPDSPLDVTTIEYSQVISEAEYSPRFVNNGTDTTFHSIWVSQTPLPLPTGFEAQGDFNGNLILELDDLQLIAEQIQVNGSGDTDLNLDGVVNQLDLNVWVKDFYGTWIGDANLDGEFNSGDMVGVFQAGKYELAVEAGWADGDWTGDQRFDSGDFIAAFQDGGYESGARVAVSSVPEPSGALLFGIGIICACRLRIGQSPCFMISPNKETITEASFRVL